jgi:hypothetical protein
MTDFIVDTDGTLRTIYDDELIRLVRSVGLVTVSRASAVEPADGGGWTADMANVGGPVLGPFDTRREALKAEVEWIMAHGIPAVRRKAGE